MTYSAATARAFVHKGVLGGASLGAGLWVEMHLVGGMPLKFHQLSAANLGDYSGQYVHQRCFMQRSGPWTVFFRPDTDGNRDEVVVEYGIWPVPQGIVPVHIQQPFSVRIGRGDIVLATVQVPAQYWMTRWRWQSAPRPLRRTTADLKAMRAILPPSTRALYGTEPAFSAPRAVWIGPMGTAGLATAMGMAGGRPEIGPITEAQAAWLMFGTEAARSAMMAQAEAVGSLPIWLRDARTNAPIDVYANKYLALRADASAAHTPIYPAAPKDAAGKVRATFLQLSCIPIVFVPVATDGRPLLPRRCAIGGDTSGDLL